jgi:hypothetical protein
MKSPGPGLPLAESILCQGKVPFMLGKPLGYDCRNDLQSEDA